MHECIERTVLAAHTGSFGFSRYVINGSDSKVGRWITLFDVNYRSMHSWRAIVACFCSRSRWHSRHVVSGVSCLMLSLVACQDHVVTRHGTRFIKSGKSDVVALYSCAARNWRCFQRHPLHHALRRQLSRSHPLATFAGYSYQVNTVQQSVRDRNLGSWISLPKKRQHLLEQAAWLDAEFHRGVAARFPHPALSFQQSCQSRRHSKILV